MPHVNYCKLCGTPVRFDGRKWVHYRDLDHVPQMVHVRTASPADSIREAARRDEVSVDNILRLATICVGGCGNFDEVYELIDMLMADVSVTMEFMHDDSVDDSHKIGCVFALADLREHRDVIGLLRKMWCSEKLSGTVRGTLEWLHTTRGLPIKTPTPADKLLDMHGW